MQLNLNSPTEFAEDFLVLSGTNSVILGNAFSVEHDISISPKQGFFQSPDVTVQNNEIKPVNEKRRAIRHKKIPIYTNKKHTIQPTEQILLECYLPDKTDQFENKSGVLTPNELSKKKQIALTSSLSTVGKNNTLYVFALNISEHPITINSRTKEGIFSILSIEQADQLINRPTIDNVCKIKKQKRLICGIEPSYPRLYPAQTRPI